MDQDVAVLRRELGEQVQADGRVDGGRALPQLFQLHQVEGSLLAALAEEALQHLAHGAMVQAARHAFGDFWLLVVSFGHVLRRSPWSLIRLSGSSLRRRLSQGKTGHDDAVAT
ncbi:hypothetical protein D9M71_626800 [compost metagenome]